MVTKRLRKTEKDFLKKLGIRVRKIIIEEKKYSSLDAFWLQYSDLVAKPTLYQICDGKRDMKISTLLGLAEALEISVYDLLNG